MVEAARPTPQQQQYGVPPPTKPWRWKIYTVASLFGGVLALQFMGIWQSHSRSSYYYYVMDVFQQPQYPGTALVPRLSTKNSKNEATETAVLLSSRTLRNQAKSSTYSSKRPYYNRRSPFRAVEDAVVTNNIVLANQQAVLVASKALQYRIQTSIVLRQKPDNATLVTLELPLTNASLPRWQQTIVYKRAASERLRRGGDVVSPLPMTPLHVYNLHHDDDGDGGPLDTNRTRPILAIITATRSHNEKTVADADLQKRLIQSIAQTITVVEQSLWRMQLWIGVDDVDTWWVQHWRQLIAPTWLEVYVCIIPDKIHRVPFTEVAYAAYTSATPPDYLVRVNDDTGFLTSRWLTLAAANLQSFDPPNVGVVGPECQAGNSMILTHDFVHATHMEIFQGYYYPTVFRNWYLDDWISTVYSDRVLGKGFHRKTVMTKIWKVRHWISSSSYEPHVVDSQWLPTEYELGRKQIRNYVLALNASKGRLIPETLPFIHESEVVTAIKQYLPPNGNLLVWGLTEKDSPTLHMMTSGRVVFFGDVDPSRVITHNARKMYSNDYIYLNFPFLSYTNAVFKTARGNWSQTFHTYLDGQTFDNNTNWCDLLVPLFPLHLLESEWDVILVQDQLGNGDKPGAGVLQPLFNSMLITANQTGSSPNAKMPHIMIHNFDRPFEQDASLRIFERKPNAILNNGSMAVYSIGTEDHRRYDWISDCPRPLLRLPSMYVGPWTKPEAAKLLTLIQPTDNILSFGIQNQPRFWHYSTTGEVLFLENIDNATQIETLSNEYPELSILPVNFTSHSMQANRIRSTKWNVLMLHPQVRDRIAVFKEIERLKAMLLKPPLLVIVAAYHVAAVTEYSNRLFGPKPNMMFTRGPKREQQLLAIFTIGGS